MVENVNTFSVDGVIRDLQSDAPDVYQLFQTLGNTREIEEVIKIHTPLRIKGIEFSMHPIEC